jgi:PAP2 superfamily
MSVKTGREVSLPSADITTALAEQSGGREELRAHGLRASVENGLLREVALVTAAMVAYFGIRNITAGDPLDAFANSNTLVDLESFLGVRWEDTVQSAIVGSDLLTTIANWVYIWGHWPVILTTAVALYLWRRDRYYTLRNALFISGAIGFLFFALMPVAPPRLAELGLVDTVSDHSDAYRALQPPGLTNQYAAFPSLHVGWNMAVGLVLFVTTTHLVVRSFALLSPLAMAFAVIATANHFVVDVVGGVAVVLVGLAGALLIERRNAEVRATLRAPDGPVTAVEKPRRERGPVSRRTPRGKLFVRSSRGATARVDNCRS